MVFHGAHLFGDVISEFNFAEEKWDLIAFGFEKSSQDEIRNPENKGRYKVKQHIKKIRRKRKKLDKCIGINLKKHFGQKL
jgi:hypothetical protein